MSELFHSRFVRAAAFALCNALALLCVVELIVVPFCARFGNRRVVSAAMIADFQRLQGLKARIERLSADTAMAGDPFLASGDARIASADLQAILQRKARQAEARFLGVRSVAPSRTAGPGAVAARLDIEGPASAVQAALTDFEMGVPLLLVTSAILRSDNPGSMQADLLHAELVVEANMKRPARAAALDLRGLIPPLDATATP